ncbi:MAG: LysR family transcriptional regulator [Lachnospiraceae bacterium]
MTIQQLKYIITVVECGTISQAANKLFISQPSLTNAIRDIEEEMQISIFGRTNRGVVLTPEGEEFIGYARQVLEQTALMEEKYKGSSTIKELCISTQHYSFAVNAFVDVIKQYTADSYNFRLRETQTHEIIDDVARLKSELGIIYINDFNRAVISKLLKERQLVFEELFMAAPHVFISSRHPLAGQEVIKLADLEDYPYLSFEQGAYNSFYFSEEILSTVSHRKNIQVRDRATLFNCLIGLDGYTFSSGVIDEKLNGKDIISVPLENQDRMHIGFIRHKKTRLSHLGQIYIEKLKRWI